ncbi:CGNR zinc finger domain-containing protein [Streptomyces sp. JW3]|uniref:CGNR zinc finger domain-containing protein n=1 Tax=Streptomyces sp. JW3 TaxID=3456955 RepID=UPI003FA40561
MSENRSAPCGSAAPRIGDGGAGRFRVAAAPGDLRVVQDLLNTAPVPKRRGDVPDLLDAPDTAALWLGGHGIGGGDPAVGLGRLRELRDVIRGSLIARDHGPDGGDGAARTGVEATVRLRLAPDGTVDFAPGPPGIPALVDRVLAALYDAQHAGTWRRMKMCRNPECLVAFWDSSRNTSGVWHSVKTCGNAANLRRSRARRAAVRPPAGQ